MNPPNNSSAQAGTTLRLLLGILILALLPVILFATEPQWWTDRGIKTTDPANDYAAVNQGQLKNIAKAAAAELDATLPGGAGDPLHTLINNWTTPTAQTNDYAPVNLGQLKTVAVPFYDQLLSAGYQGHPLQSGTYPWIGKETTANDYAMANIGQVKNLFSFDATFKTDPNNPLPDWWQIKHFGQLGIDPAANPDGDGATNLEEINNGTDPNDYYNGVLPALRFMSGMDQRAAPGTVLPLPLAVKVNNYDYNAPITFTVTSGSALLAPINGNAPTPSTSAMVRSIDQYLAQVYIYLPNNSTDLSVITATATSGTRTITISTTAATTDPTLIAPTNLTATPTSPTTVSLTWTPSDINQPTTIQASNDGGTNWFIVGVAPAGATSAIITGLTPDVTVSFRVITGNCSTSDPSDDPTFPMPSPSEPGTPTSGGTSPGNTAGGGSSPSSNISVQPLSRPVVAGQKITTWGSREIFPGFVNSTTQYYKRQIYYASSGSGTRTITTTFDPQTQAFTSGTVTSGVGAGGVSGDWIIESDTYKFRSNSKGHFESYALDEEYTLPQFISDVENLQPEYTSDFIDELCDAHILLTEDNLWYEYSKLRYKFKVNKDPNGTITWYAKFMPYKNGYGTAYDLEGPNVKYDICNMATNGATEVPSPLGFIDPLHDSKLNPNKQNGKYEVGVLPIEIAVDANRDGVIKLSGTNTGSQGGISTDDKPTDTTTADKPYRFWINDDHDDPSDGDVIDSAHDYNNENITCIRDLEDYARLWLDVGCVTNMVRYSGIKVGLQFKPASGETWAEGDPKPAIKIFPAYETDGGRKYLTDGTTANYQIGGVYDVPVKNTQGGAIVSTDPFFFTTEFFDGMWWNYNTIKHLLFEGVHEGKGKLVMVFYKGDQKIGEGGSLYLDLKNVKKMYERAKVTPENISDPSQQQAGPFTGPVSYVSDPNGNAFDKPWDESKQCMIFVHGWNNTYNDYANTSETLFKRLWWQGYKGHIAAFRWDTLTQTSSLDPGQFNRSENRAWIYGAALKAWIDSLNNSGYTVNLIGHSMGNVVSGEALNQGAHVRNYFLMQAAVPASCYDPNVATEQRLVDAESQTITPDWHASSKGYRGYLQNIAGILVNYYNPDDFALQTGQSTVLGATIKSNWVKNQIDWKPNASTPAGPVRGSSSWFYGYTLSYPVSTASWLYNSSFYINPNPAYNNDWETRAVTDSWEVKAFVARSRSRAAGAQGATSGPIEDSVDLKQTYQFSTSRPDHSGQFTRNIQQVFELYDDINQRIEE